MEKRAEEFVNSKASEMAEVIEEMNEGVSEGVSEGVKTDTFDKQVKQLLLLTNLAMICKDL